MNFKKMIGVSKQVKYLFNSFDYVDIIYTNGVDIYV